MNKKLMVLFILISVFLSCTFLSADKKKDCADLKIKYIKLKAKYLAVKKELDELKGIQNAGGDIKPVVTKSTKVPLNSFNIKKRIKKIKKKFSVRRDKFEGMYWIKAKRYGYKMYLYFGINEKGQVYPPRVVINYSGSDWLFIEEYSFLIDGERYVFKPEYNDIARDTGDYGITENIDASLSGNESLVKLIYALAKGKKAKMRFYGSKGYSNYRMVESDLKKFKDVLWLYKSLGGKL